MKKIILSRLCLALALVQASCTSQLFINTTLPAEVAVTNAQWKVAAINRYNPDLLDFNQEKKIDVFAAGAKEAFNGAISAIEEDATYAVVHIADSTYRVQAENEPLTSAQVQDIYRQHPHHLLLALNNFEAYFDQETVREEDENGDIAKTAHYTLVTRAHWSLHDSTGAMLDQVILSERVPYQSRAVISGLLAIGPSMGNAGPEVVHLAWETGQKYWSRLSPKDVTLVRSYYAMNNLQPAATRMAAGDWASAITLLKPLAEGQHKKDAARAAYNLAVVYEALGDIAAARHWAKLAAEKNDRLAVLLLPDLENY